MAKNEGTVTIPIDRYLELTKFVDDVIAKDTMLIHSYNNSRAYIVFTKDDFIITLTENNRSLEECNEEFERHNQALQKRISDFNSKPWYQRVFKSKV